MNTLIYVEEQIQDHPRVQRILQRFTHKTVIPCGHYAEVFNRKSQNFRIQKNNPALILAEKQEGMVLPTPEGFGIGSCSNYYFSHMLNCPFDCRYCFLQGMYRSANYVVFINYEDFFAQIKALADASDTRHYFFSGYDADSLAYEPVTGFVAECLPFFSTLPQATLELRTKSANVRALLRHKPIDNCVVAFSMTPDEIAQSCEHKTPAMSKRIAALHQLAQAGWQVGVRLDPLIHTQNYATVYPQLIEAIFSQLPADSLHSVSVGPLRFPAKMHRAIQKLYPQEKLLSAGLVKQGKIVSYAKENQAELAQCVRQSLAQYVDQSRIFTCHS